MRGGWNERGREMGKKERKGKERLGKGSGWVRRRGLC